MGNLVIKNVDLDKLEKAVCELFSINDGVLDTMLSPAQSLALSNIRIMLSCAVDLHKQKSLGSTENQKAKERQQSFCFVKNWKVCLNCGWEGSGDSCQKCGSAALTPMEFVK